MGWVRGTSTVVIIVAVLVVVVMRCEVFVPYVPKVEPKNVDVSL